MSVPAAWADDSEEPMIEMNMMPLIDVMLVLLIMFIVTIRARVHAAKLDMRSGNSAVETFKNVIDAAGRIY